MAKSLLKTVIDSSRSKTEEREKTKRAQLRAEKARTENEIMSRKTYAKNQKAMAERDRAANELELTRAAERDKIRNIQFDPNNIPEIIGSLINLSTIIDSSDKKSSFYKMVLEKFSMGTKLLKSIDKSNPMLETFESKLKEIFSDMNFLSRRISGSDYSKVHTIRNFVDAQPKDKEVLLDALKTTYSIYLSIKKPLILSFGRGEGNSEEERNYEILVRSYYDLVLLSETNYAGDPDFSFFLSKKEEIKKDHKKRKLRILIILLSLLLFSLTMMVI